jgi:hypothetical protein
MTAITTHRKGCRRLGLRLAAARAGLSAADGARGKRTSCTASLSVSGTVCLYLWTPTGSDARDAEDGKEREQVAPERVHLDRKHERLVVIAHCKASDANDERRERVEAARPAGRLGHVGERPAVEPQDGRREDASGCRELEQQAEQTAKPEEDRDRNVLDLVDGQWRASFGAEACSSGETQRRRSATFKGGRTPERPRQRGTHARARCWRCRRRKCRPTRPSRRSEPSTCVTSESYGRQASSGGADGCSKPSRTCSSQETRRRRGCASAQDDAARIQKHVLLPGAEIAGPGENPVAKEDAALDEMCEAAVEVL